MKTRVPVVPRAHWHAWAGTAGQWWRGAKLRARTTRAALRQARERGHITTFVMIAIGVAGLLLGGWTVGTWLLGLTAMGISGYLVWLGLERDDGTPMPQRGARTVDDVLDDERLRPEPDRVDL